MTFMAASSAWWTEKAQDRADAASNEGYLAWLQKHVGNAKPISEISDTTIARLVTLRRGEGVGPASINRSVCEPMRAILNRARKVWKQKVQDIDWKEHFQKEPQEIIREATPEEEAKLLDAIRGDYAPALLFAILSGCRRAEIVGIKWADVDFFSKRIKVTGKGDRSRHIPMTNAIRSLIWEQRNLHREAVFTYVCRRPREGQVKGERYPITMEGFKTAWRRARARTDVVGFRFHDTRHTAATRLLRSSGNLKLVQRLLGHTQIATTARYAHVTDDDLRNAMESAHSATENATATGIPAIKPLKSDENI